MWGRHTLELTILVNGVPMLHKQLRGRSLTIGHHDRNAVALDVPFERLELLEALPQGGYGMHLAPGLGGKIRVGGHTLRVEDGLLCDPRPEPLRLGDGDRGAFFIGERFQLRFAVTEQRRAFVPSLVPRDRPLMLSLGSAALVLLGVVGMVVSRPLPPKNRAKTLRALNALAKRTFAHQRKSGRTKKTPAKRPEAVAGKGSGTTVRQRRSSTRLRRRVALRRVARRVERATRGVDKLLASLDHVGRAAPRATAGARKGRKGSRDPLAALDALLPSAAKRTFASAAIPSVGRQRLRMPSRARPKRPLAASPRSGGGLTRDAIKRVVARHSAAVRTCYERSLLRSQKAVEGTVLLRWRIDAGGNARSIQVVRDGVKRPGLRRCLLREVPRWRFPACGRAGGCLVIFPFEFFARS